MVWTLSHDNKIVGEWTDQFVQKVSNAVNMDMEVIAEFLPDPIRNKIEHKEE